MKLTSLLVLGITAVKAQPNFYSTIPKCSLTEVEKVKEFVTTLSQKGGPKAHSASWNGDEYKWNRSYDQKPVLLKVMVGKEDDKRRLSMETEIETLALLEKSGVTPKVDCYYIHHQGMFYIKEDIHSSNVKSILNEGHPDSLQFYNPGEDSIHCKWAEKALAMTRTLSLYHSHKVVALSSMLEDWVLTDNGNIILNTLTQSRLLGSKQPVPFPYAPELLTHPKGFSFKTDVYLLGQLLEDLLQDMQSFRTRQLSQREDPKVLSTLIQPILDQMKKKIEKERVTMPETISLLIAFQKEQQCASS